jgi:hypothetical protein
MTLDITLTSIEDMALTMLLTWLLDSELVEPNMLLDDR